MPRKKLTYTLSLNTCRDCGDTYNPDMFDVCPFCFEQSEDTYYDLTETPVLEEGEQGI
jgi:uncharacterized OB-fold protein